jgi:hypothetical protein
MGVRPMSEQARKQIGQLSQNADALLRETWELFARLRKTNEKLIQQTDEIAWKLTCLSQRRGDDEPA